jgi:hypothetical protein
MVSRSGFLQLATVRPGERQSEWRESKNAQHQGTQANIPSTKTKTKRLVRAWSLAASEITQAGLEMARKSGAGRS